MSLPRKHNLEQLRKLRKITKGKDIGDIVKKGEHKEEGRMPNAYWMDNPLDRNIDTYESFVKNDNKIQTTSIKESLNIEEDAFIIWENYLIQNEEFINKNSMNIELIVNDIVENNDYKEGIEEMRDNFYDIIQNHMDMEMVEESFHNKGKGPGNDPYFTNSFKQVLTSQLSPSILQIGKFVKVGKIEGYIDSVDEEFVYITSIKGDGKKEKIPFKKFMKGIEDTGVINEKSGFPSEYWTEREVLPMPEIEEEPEYEPIVEPLPLDEPEEETIEIQREEEVTTPEPDEDEIQKERETAEPEEDMISFPDSRRGSIYGTEDDPMGLRHKHNENIYNNDFKGVKCDDCGQIVEDTYKAKVAHVYNKHFNKPSMDGAVPIRKYSYDTTWPQGGVETQKLVLRYFPKN